MSEGRWVSPQQLYDAGKKMMLENKEPVNTKDWQLLVNFFCVNVDRHIGSVAIKLICKIFDCPLPDEQIEDIFAYHLNLKNQYN